VFLFVLSSAHDITSPATFNDPTWGLINWWILAPFDPFEKGDCFQNRPAGVAWKVTVRKSVGRNERTVAYFPSNS
jgi:hypothetical protein